MTRIAIVIAVNENLPPLQSLSACSNDGAAIKAILAQTGRFDEILYLHERNQTASGEVKSQIANLVSKHKRSSVEELIFYFSGHGDFVGDEFYFILSDYKAPSRNSTSLANSELDEMMRGVSPQLFVKIVDACHSGTSYIKSAEGFNEYLKSAKGKFQDLYFLYSSQSDEVSWTAGKLSAFTASILNALDAKETGIVRYRDLMSAASDYFEAEGGQTPHFVTQADFTQVFCEATPQLKSIVRQFIDDAAKVPAEVTAEKRSALLERVKEASSTYCNKEGAIAALAVFEEAIKAEKAPGDLQDLFEVRFNVIGGDEPGAVVIGDWLSKNTDRKFFAKPIFRSEAYKKRVRDDFVGLTKWLTDPVRPTVFIDATRLVISGYENTTAIAPDRSQLYLEPRFKALEPWVCRLVPIVSAYELTIFWCAESFRYTDWDTITSATSELTWENVSAKLGNAAQIKAACSEITAAFFRVVQRSLESKWLRSSD